MSPQNFNSQKKTGGAAKEACRVAVENGANPEWLRTGQGNMKNADDSPAAALSSSLIEAVIKFQGECISRLTDDLRDVRRRIEAMEKRCDDCNGQLDGLDDKIKLCETICEMAAQATRKARAG